MKQRPDMADESSIFDFLNNVLPGSMSTLVGAFLGRAMWHGVEVKARRRKFFGRELIWEIPVVLGMWMIGLGVGEYMELHTNATAAVCAILAYLGPKGTEAALARWKGGEE
jgi:hypothetical protein